MKILSTFLFLAISGQSFAYNYEVLNRYEKTAKALELEISSAEINATFDTTKAFSLLDQLTNEGIEIMDLYVTKKTECLVQYNTFKSEVSVMADLPFEVVHKKYHDGVGLPEAPRLCYLGRSQVVHPVLTKIVLKEGWNQEIKEEALHEVEEVIEHLEKIQNVLSK